MPSARTRCPQSESTTAAAPYLLAGAPSFDQSISQFREKFNADNPKLPLNEFRSIATSRDRANLTRAASKINENLCLHRAGARHAEDQIHADHRCRSRAGAKGGGTKALEYMSAMIRAFVPTLAGAKPAKTAETAGRRQGKRYFADTEGAVRYVVADHGEKGLTFAIEPIKLALSETLEGNNK